jgi:hypothetical protein
VPSAWWSARRCNAGKSCAPFVHLAGGRVGSRWVSEGAVRWVMDRGRCDGIRRTELVTSTAVDKVDEARSLFPLEDLKLELVEAVLGSPVVPAGKGERVHAALLVDAARTSPAPTRRVQTRVPLFVRLSPAHRASVDRDFARKDTWVSRRLGRSRLSRAREAASPSDEAASVLLRRRPRG